MGKSNANQSLIDIVIFFKMEKNKQFKIHIVHLCDVQKESKTMRSLLEVEWIKMTL